MWRDSTDKRLKRYKMILSKAPALYSPAKKAYMKCPSVKGNQNIIKNTTLFVLAPAINAYVGYVLKKALEAGHKRLYFLARDGYFMYQCASILCKEWNIPIECRYLCCSRYSIRIPMFHLNMDDAFDYICRGGIDVTYDKIFNRAGLEKEAKISMLAYLGADDLKRIIPYAELENIKAKLKESSFFRSEVERISKERYPLLDGYLKQEGLLDGTSYALVDSGWTGSMQKVLGELLNHAQSSIIKRHSKTKLYGYYWGLYELPPDVDAKRYDCYYFAPATDFKRKIHFSNCLFEGIYSAPHGMTLRYIENSTGGFEPVFDDIRTENKSFINITGRYISLYTSELVKERSLSDVVYGTCGQSGRDDFLDVVSNLLDLFMGTPTRDEANIYGHLPFSDDVLDTHEQDVAAKLSKRQLYMNHPINKATLMLGFRRGRLQESAWIEGSAVRAATNKEVKKSSLFSETDEHLRAYALYKGLLYLKKELVRWKGLVKSGRK